MAASVDLGPCWQGESATCPKELKSIFGGLEDFYGQLRNPKKDPASEVWDCVRAKYAVLADRSDEELLACLQPIKMQYVDRRTLK